MERRGERVAFGAAVLLALAIADGFDLVRVTLFQLGRGDTERPLWNAGAFAFTWLCGALGLVLVLLHPWRWLRIAALGFAAAAGTVHVGFLALNGSGFGHHEAAIFFSEAAFLPDALEFFAPGYLGPVAVVVVVAVLFGIWARRAAFRGGAGVLLLPLLVGSLAAAALIDRTFGKVYEAPLPVRVPLLAHFAWQHAVPFYGPRDTPTLEPAGPPLAPHIVLVMDESVSGHWLGVNGGHPGTTPWLASAPSHVFGYGVVSAISNLSSSTNLLLMAGLGPDGLPDRELHSLRAPSLFAYMQRAGFRTAFFDAQSYSDRLPNMMTRFDLGQIDVHRIVREEQPGLPEHEIDDVALSWLVEHVRGAERSFSYVLKNGAHLPYHDKYPPERAVFPDGGRANAYRNAIAWSADAFLERLSGELEAGGREVLVLYTSDHGQAIGPETESSRRFTPHATEVAPPSAQAAVPLFLLGFGPETRARLAALHAPSLAGTVSQFEVFPALLEAAGYAREEATAGRAPSLFDAEAARPARIFASGNVFAREGGFYLLNRGMGSVCHLNAFAPPEPDAGPGSSGR